MKDMINSVKWEDLLKYRKFYEIIKKCTLEFSSVHFLFIFEITTCILFLMCENRIWN